MSRLDLNESQLAQLQRWAQIQPDREKGEQIIAVVSEVRTLRERESSTRFLMEIEGEV